MFNDAVDTFLAQWAAERPELDVTAMAPIGRLHRATRLVSRSIREYFNEQDMQEWEFDVLATLRRAGSPYQLSPKDLVAVTMVGSSALTHRIDHLVKRNYVTREVDPSNRRQLLLTLTAEGRELVDQVVEGHIKNENRLLEGLDPAEREQLNLLLRKLLLSLGDRCPTTEVERLLR
ncbi:MAG: MarR family transcriptional regulator [Actinomycetota bacterium]|nr:MarR family transcriptional regulator [Actinomycetota bacterium]